MFIGWRLIQSSNIVSQIAMLFFFYWVGTLSDYYVCQVMNVLFLLNSGNNIKKKQNNQIEPIQQNIQCVAGPRDSFFTLLPIIQR